MENLECLHLSVAVRQEFVRQRLTDVLSEPHSNRQESSVISLHAVCTEVLGHIADPDKRLDIKDAPWTIIVQPCPICCMLSHTAACDRRDSSPQLEYRWVFLISWRNDVSYTATQRERVVIIVRNAILGHNIVKLSNGMYREAWCERVVYIHSSLVWLYLLVLCPHAKRHFQMERELRFPLLCHYRQR